MNLTIEEAYESYFLFASSKKKPQTMRVLKSRFCCHILPFFQGMKIQHITASKYLEWQEWIISKNYSYRYIKGLHASNVAFFDFLITYHEVNKNIPRQVGTFANNVIRKEKKINVWNKKTFRKFIRNVHEEKYSLFFTLLYKTGLRLGEACALTWNDIDFKNRTLAVNKTISKEFFNGERAITPPKTKTSIRTIRLNFILCIRLRSYMNNYIKKNDDFNRNMFIFGFSKPLAPTTIDKKKNRACKLAGIEPIRIHDFRHSHSTNLLEKGVPLSVVSERLGHSRKSTTLDIYTHISSTKEKRAQFMLNLL